MFLSKGVPLWSNLQKKIITAAVGFVIMALLPLLGLGEGNAENMAEEIVSAVQSMSDSQEKSLVKPEDSEEEPQGDAAANGTDSFVILDTGSGNVVTIDDRSFCVGALAYEMLPSCDEEALKAQCIACYTHFCRLRDSQREKPDDELKGAYLKADLTNGKVYLSDEILKEKWGEQYEKYKSKLSGAVDAVFGKKLTDGNGELIDACYFALSSGMTENAEDIFGFESPYLKAVPSPWDKQAPGWCSEKTVSRKEFYRLLSSGSNEFSEEKGIGEIKRTPGGSIISAEIGGVQFTGMKLREIFGLRSANIEITPKGDNIVFTVKGYGHGVGMSQYGADAMAKQGADYREILLHYYGVTI